MLHKRSQCTESRHNRRYASQEVTVTAHLKADTIDAMLPKRSQCTEGRYNRHHASQETDTTDIMLYKRQTQQTCFTRGRHRGMGGRGGGGRKKQRERERTH